MGSLTDRLWAEVESYVAAEGIELDDLEVLGDGPAKIVRVTLDGPDLGVDRIAETSRGLSRLLDDVDPIAGAYTLEVSSPGLERKLRRPSHYIKSVGREVKVKTFAPVEGDRAHQGVITAVDDDAFTIDVDGASRQIPFEAVASARTVFEWQKTAKPGSRS